MPDWGGEIRKRLAGLKLAPPREAEIIEELTQHLEDRYKELVSGGATGEEARNTVLQELSDKDLLATGLRRVEREALRELIVPGAGGGSGFLASIWSDFRYGLRTLRRNPGFTAVAVATLALGIGATTAIFSVVNAVLLQSLPYPDSGRLVEVQEELPQLDFKAGTFSPPDYEDLARENRVFEGIAAYQNRKLELSGVDQPEQVTGARISASLFSVLGRGPSLGRAFTAEEETKRAMLAVLSYGLWQRRFGGVPGVVGKEIVLDRIAYTVVGVMPQGFTFPDHGPQFNNEPADVFIPMSFTPDELQGFGWGYNSSVVARLKPGVTVAEAQAECRLILHRFESQYPAILQQDPRFELSASVSPLREALTGRVESVLWVLFAAVGMVLLIACANVSNLLLARAEGRQREMAVRTALGAARSRLVRQVLTESLILALGGAGLGLLIAAWGGKALVSIAPVSLPREGGIHPDGTVLGFTLALGVMTALLFGLAPALRASHTDFGEALKEAGRSGTASRGHRRLLGALATGQFALSLVLLTGAGLLVRSLVRLLATDSGFQPERVLSLSTSLPGKGYGTGSQIRAFYQNLLGHVEALPGVRAAAEATVLPLNSLDRRAFTAEMPSEAAGGTPNLIPVVWVLGDYFKTLGIPLVKGRFFDSGDVMSSEQVIIINQTAAQRYWPGQDAVGRRIKWGAVQSPSPWMTVVGVVGDVKNGPLNAPTLPAAYLPYLQVSDSAIEDESFGEYRNLHLMVGTQSDPTALVNSIRAVVAGLDPSLPITNVGTMEQLIHRSTRPQQFNTFLISVFAGLALILAAVGVYGVVSYTTRQRTHEFGIRMALGAERADIVTLGVAKGLALALVGVSIGLAGALALTRFLTGMLYGVKPTDPLTFIAVPFVLTVVALIASYIPARRATKVDPMVALRYE